MPSTITQDHSEDFFKACKVFDKASATVSAIGMVELTPIIPTRIAFPTVGPRPANIMIWCLKLQIMIILKSL